MHSPEHVVAALGRRCNFGRPPKPFTTPSAARCRSRAGNRFAAVRATHFYRSPAARPSPRTAPPSTTRQPAATAAVSAREPYQTNGAANKKFTSPSAINITRVNVHAHFCRSGRVISSSSASIRELHPRRICTETTGHLDVCGDLRSPGNVKPIELRLTGVGSVAVSVELHGWGDFKHKPSPTHNIPPVST